MSQRKSRDLNKYKNNPHIEKITESNIQFTKEFKIKSIKKYQSGTSPNCPTIRVTEKASHVARCFLVSLSFRFCFISSNDFLKKIRALGKVSGVKKNTK